MRDRGNPSSVRRCRSDPSRRNWLTPPLGVTRESSALLPLLIKGCSASFSCQPPLEDDGGGGTVDVFFPDAPAPFAARALCLESLVRLQRGPALVDTFHGDSEAAFQLGGETARVSREGARGTVGIIRSADDQEVGLKGTHFPRNDVPVRPSRDHLRCWPRAGRAGERVAGGDADAFLAEVERQDGLDGTTRGSGGKNRAFCRRQRRHDPKKAP